MSTKQERIHNITMRAYELGQELLSYIGGTGKLAPNFERPEVTAADVGKARANLRERFIQLDRALEHVQLAKIHAGDTSMEPGKVAIADGAASARQVLEEVVREAGHALSCDKMKDHHGACTCWHWKAKAILQAPEGL